MSSIRDVLNYHTLHRTLYETLLALGTTSPIARQVIMLWTWLELININVLNYLQDCNNNRLILKFVEEAELILIWLHTHTQLPDVCMAIPHTASLMDEEFFNIRFFVFNYEIVKRGLARISSGMGTVIFDDYLNRLLVDYESERTGVVEEGVRRVRQRGGSRFPALPTELAARYEPPAFMIRRSDCRTLFITFANGQPLRREELFGYFQGRTGDVENVEVERTSGAVTPLFARVVFRNEASIDYVLNRCGMLKLEVNGKAMWARKYCLRPE